MLSSVYFLSVLGFVKTCWCTIKPLLWWLKFPLKRRHIRKATNCFKIILVPADYTATNSYFHHHLICRLFSPLIVYSMKCPKSAKNAHLNFPDPSVTPLTCFFCPNNISKHTKNVSFIIINDAETQPILTFKRPNQQLFTVLQKKDKRLIDYQKSWQLIFWQLINQLFD